MDDDDAGGWVELEGIGRLCVVLERGAEVGRRRYRARLRGGNEHTWNCTRMNQYIRYGFERDLGLVGLRPFLKGFRYVQG